MKNTPGRFRWMGRARTVAATLLVAGVISHPVWVQAQTEERQSAPTVDEPPEGVDERDQEARALYEAGVIAFDAGRFRNALEAFQSAYELSQRPALLYNVGSAADRLRLDAVALEAFERYMAADPSSVHAGSVQARIEVLRKAVARQQEQDQGEPTEAPATPADEPPASARSGSATPDGPAGKSSTWPQWTTLGGGAALLAAGVVTLGIGQRNRSRIEDADAGTPFSEVRKYDNANTLTGVGIAMAVVGAAGVALGTVWIVGRPGSDTRLGLTLTPTGLSLRGSL